jgi:hypothetical protein
VLRFTFQTDPINMHDLLQNIILTKPSSELVILNQLQLSSFESETGIVLPEEYKNYFQVIGSGLLADLVKIYYPSPSLVESSKKLLDFVKKDIKIYPSKDKLSDRKLIDWLNHIFFLHKAKSYLVVYFYTCLLQ